MGSTLHGYVSMMKFLWQFHSGEPAYGVQSDPLRTKTFLCTSNEDTDASLIRVFARRTMLSGSG